MARGLTVSLLLGLSAVRLALSADITIGIAGPRTGGAGNILDAVLPVVNLAVTEVNANTNVLASDTIVLGETVDTGCDQWVANAATSVFVETSRPALVVGPACSGGTTGANTVLAPFEIVHLSPWSTNPTLSDSSTYKGLVRLSPVFEYKGFVGVLKSFDIDRFALVYTDDAVAKATLQGVKTEMPDALLLFETEVTTVSTTNSDAIVDNMIDTGAKVVLLGDYGTLQLSIWCSAYKRGYYGGDMMYLMTSWVSTDFISSGASNTDCSASEIIAGASNAFGVEGPIWPISSSSAYSTAMSNGKTPAEVLTSYTAACGTNCNEGLAALYYDAMWDSFFAIHNFMQNPTTWTANGLASSDFGTSAAGTKRTQLYDGLYQQFLSANFEGITGTVTHDANGDRTGRLTIRWIDHTQGGIVVTAGIWQYTSDTVVWQNSITMVDGQTHYPPGGQTATFADAPVSCPTGTQRNALLSCEACSTGYYNNVTDGTCTACATGTYANGNGTTDCSTCAAGTFTSTTGTVNCTSCPVGRSRAASEDAFECNRCAIGWYQDEVGKSECKQCPDTLTTPSVGAVQLSDCTCAEGSFLNKRENRCITCSESFSGMKCVGGSAIPEIAEGFWAEVLTTEQAASFENPKVYVCKDRFACPGGSIDPANLTASSNTTTASKASTTAVSSLCKGGRVGLVCDSCPEGFFTNSESGCTECPGTFSWPLFLLFFLGLIILILVYYFTNGEYSGKSSSLSRATTSVTLTFVFVQQIAVLSQIEIVYPATLTNGIDLLKIVSVDFDSLQWECFAPGATPFNKYLFRIMVPVIFGALLFVCMGLSYVGHYFLKEKLLPWQLNKVLNTLGFFVSILYVWICVSVLMAFDCRLNPSGEKNLRAYPTVFCNTEDHNPFIALGSVCIVMYIVCGMCFVATVLFMAPKWQERYPAFRTRYKYLFAKFQPRYWWWGFIYTLYNFLVALAPILEPDDGRVAVTILFIFTAAILIPQVQFRPWNDRLNNILDLVQTTAFLYICYVGVAYTEDTDRSGVVLSAAAGLFAGAGMLLGLYVITVGAVEIIWKERTKRKEYLAMLRVSGNTLRACNLLVREAQQVAKAIEEGSTEELPFEYRFAVLSAEDIQTAEDFYELAMQELIFSQTVTPYQHHSSRLKFTRWSKISLMGMAYSKRWSMRGSLQQRVSLQNPRQSRLSIKDNTTPPNQRRSINFAGTTRTKTTDQLLNFHDFAPEGHGEGKEGFEGVKGKGDGVPAEEDDGDPQSRGVDMEGDEEEVDFSDDSAFEVASENEEERPGGREEGGKEAFEGSDFEIASENDNRVEY